MNSIILLFLAKICEAIYFTIFLIYGKRLKEKRLLLLVIMITEYLLLKSFIQFNVLFQILYTFMSFVNLKVLYKDKAQVTDIFLFTSASLILVVISAICSGIVILINSVWFYYVMLVINRILIFAFVIIFRNKLYKIYKKFCDNWNKHKNNKIKSLTLRNISVIVFNIIFYVINIYMLYAILTRK